MDLANQIANGDFGIENMDPKYLEEDLIENEAEYLRYKYYR